MAYSGMNLRRNEAAPKRDCICLPELGNESLAKAETFLGSMRSESPEMTCPSIFSWGVTKLAFVLIEGELVAGEPPNDSLQVCNVFLDIP